MSNFINLRHYHTESTNIKHPLFDDPERPTLSHSEEYLGCLTADVLQDKGNPVKAENLILALRSSLRHMVGRFVANWPESKPLVDEMVSEGILAISALVGDLSLDLLGGRGILKVSSQHAQNAIQDMLNKRHLTAPSVRTQSRLIKDEKDPVFLRVEAQLEAVEEHPTDAGDEWKRDIMEALSMIEAEDEIDEAILDRFNWGSTEQELADELGVDQATIHRRKRRLYQKFLEITE